MKKNVLIKLYGCPNYLLYSVWRDMKKRCYNLKNKDFKNYGGRGISVCDDWRSSFKSFIVWALTNDYEKGLTLERKDNDGPYAPWNCCFATRKEQANNTRNLKLFIAYGPCGQIEIAKNQHVFARKWELCRENISQCLCRKNHNTHKGWQFEFLKKAGC